ncbi:unnamed protein product [Caenorhabditis sp. 36 PRJEB53466]|nr:unnamed protein product [Caenorhabditis sp. 36 PRJEB53466]
MTDNITGLPTHFIAPEPQHDIYPPIGVNVEESMWSRFKKSVSNLMARAFCRTDGRQYDYYSKTACPTDGKNLPPV